MSGMELNKIFAAVLVAGIIAMVTGFVARQLVHPVELAENAYVVDTGETPAADAAQDEPALPDIGALLANADPAAGEAQTRACAACHTFEKGGANKVGPNLWDIVERPVASHEGFNYSSAMQGHGGNWTFEELNGFLLNPRQWVPGTAMSYAGLKNDKNRADLIAYLATLSDNPKPFPAPQAAEAASEETTPEATTGTGEAAGESDDAQAGGQSGGQEAVGEQPAEGAAETAPAPAPASGN